MADIILKDKNGADQTYTGITRVRMNTTDGGTQVYTEGEGGGVTVKAPTFSIVGDSEENGIYREAGLLAQNFGAINISKAYYDFMTRTQGVDSDTFQKIFDDFCGAVTDALNSAESNGKQYRLVFRVNGLDDILKIMNGTNSDGAMPEGMLKMYQYVLGHIANPFDLTDPSVIASFTESKIDDLPVIVADENRGNIFSVPGLFENVKTSVKFGGSIDSALVLFMAGSQFSGGKLTVDVYADCREDGKVPCCENIAEVSMITVLGTTLDTGFPYIVVKCGDKYLTYEIDQNAEDSAGRLKPVSDEKGVRYVVSDTPTIDLMHGGFSGEKIKALMTGEDVHAYECIMDFETETVEIGDEINFTKHYAESESGEITMAQISFDKSVCLIVFSDGEISPGTQLGTETEE